MSPVFFTNVALLAGMGALVIPILIHLLLKRQKQRLRFSTIQFFMKQDEQASQRRRLRNWLLLAVRLLLLTLLVLAFARPYLKQAQVVAASHKPRTAVFVLDCSLSMQARTAEGVRWDR